MAFEGSRSIESLDSSWSGRECPVSKAYRTHPHIESTTFFLNFKKRSAMRVVLGENFSLTERSCYSNYNTVAAIECCQANSKLKLYEKIVPPKELGWRLGTWRFREIFNIRMREQHFSLNQKGATKNKARRCSRTSIRWKLDDWREVLCKSQIF